jgi:hypothetical protein
MHGLENPKRKLAELFEDVRRETMLGDVIDVREYAEEAYRIVLESFPGKQGAWKPKKPTVRNAWSMPDPPGPEYRPYAYCPGPEGWDLFFATPQQVEEGDPEIDNTYYIEWPFGFDEWAFQSDFRALGFHDTGWP